MKPSPVQLSLPPLFYFFQKFLYENVLIIGDSGQISSIKSNIAYDMAKSIGKNVNELILVDVTDENFEEKMKQNIENILITIKDPTIVITTTDYNSYVYEYMENNFWNNAIASCTERKLLFPLIDLSEKSFKIRKELSCGTFTTTAYNPDIDYEVFNKLTTKFKSSLGKRFFFHESLLSLEIVFSIFNSLPSYDLIQGGLVLRSSLYKLKINTYLGVMHASEDNSIYFPIYSTVTSDESTFLIDNKITEQYQSQPWRDTFNFDPSVVCDWSIDSKEIIYQSLRFIAVFYPNIYLEESIDLITTMELSLNYLNTLSSINQLKYTLRVIPFSSESIKKQIWDIISMDNGRTYAIFGLREYLCFF